MHDEILLSLGRLEGKVDALIQLQRIQEDQIKNHEERIRGLEHSKSFTMGWAAAVGAAIAVGINILFKFSKA